MIKIISKSLTLLCVFVFCTLACITLLSSVNADSTINILPGTFGRTVSVKHTDEVFKNTDRILDVAGNIIKKEEYLAFTLRSSKIKNIDYSNLTNVRKNIVGDVGKLVDEDFAKVVTEVSNTGKVFDIEDYNRLKNLGQLDNIEDWFVWGRITSAGGEAVSFNGKSYMTKSWDSLEPQEIVQVKQLLSEGKSGKVISEQNIKNFDFLTDDGIAIEFKSISSNDYRRLRSVILEAEDKFITQGVQPSVKSLIDVDLTYFKSQMSKADIDRAINDLVIQNGGLYNVRIKYYDVSNQTSFIYYTPNI